MTMLLVARCVNEWVWNEVWVYHMQKALVTFSCLVACDLVYYRMQVDWIIPTRYSSTIITLVVSWDLHRPTVLVINIATAFPVTFQIKATSSHIICV